MSDPPAVDALVAGCAEEARSLAADASGEQRRRLLVLAHSLALAARELAAGEASDGGGGASLARAIRDGEHDDDLLALAARLRADVARRLEVAHPGYDAR